MSVRTEDSHPRSIAKAVSWRITGSVDTFVLSFIFTGSVKLAGSIAIAEMGTKMLLYYLHEELGLLFAGISAGNLPMDIIDTEPLPK
jgi:uncharacterized membrane protein